ncbi:hypothetical protein ACF067_28195 [Streptomyces albidoflavus]
MLEISPEDGHASFAVKSPPSVAAWAEAAPRPTAIMSALDATVAAFFRMDIIAVSPA